MGSKAPPLPEVYTNRANDLVYLDQLLDLRERQMEVGYAQMEIAQQMTQLVERVTAMYPQGIGEDALQSALAEDPAWQDLAAQEKAQTELAAQVWEESRDFIRNRMLQQMQAEKDVQDGKAKAVDKPRERVLEKDALERKKE